MSSNIDGRLKAFEANLASTKALAGADLHRKVSLEVVPGGESHEAGRREINDAFVRDRRPSPTVDQLLQYAELLGRGAASLSMFVAETGGVHPSDQALIEKGIRPRSQSPAITRADRMEVAEQMLAIVQASLRIKPGAPADAFGGGSP